MLPGTIGGGCNSIYAKLPVITPGPECNARIVTFHGGTQAGYTSFFTMLPEVDIIIVVLTNSTGLADPAGWIDELLVETMVESAHATDFVHLATEAAKNHIASIPKMEDRLEQARGPNAPLTHSLDEFVDQYINSRHKFIVEIRKKR